MRALDAADACKGVRRANPLIIFTALRASEGVVAQWSDFDLDEGTWSIPRARMKTEVEDPAHPAFEVPRPPMLAEMIAERRRMDADTSPHICPAPRNRWAGDSPNMGRMQVKRACRR